ncbi:hypothetical protein [Cetobacterium sp.]
MEKTLITKALVYVVLTGVEMLCKRTDNPVDDEYVKDLKKFFGFGDK